MPANPGHIFTPTPILKPEDIDMDSLRSLSKDSLAIWAMTSGITVDGNTVDFDTHRYLLPIYMDNSREKVWRKAAQLGATVYMVLYLLHFLKQNQGRKAGLYFPTKEGADNLSKDRIAPMIASNAELMGLSTGDDKLGLRKIGDSSLYIYHLGGVASKDSIPLDALCFDEVRLCDPKDIDQVQQRVAHSKFKYKTFMSTSGMPGDTIDARFQYGNQLTWFSACGCTNGCDLAKAFPDCMVYDDPRRPNEVYLRCPKCRWEIKNPQNGRYVPMNPNGDYNSYAVSQLVSHYITPKEIWQFYKRTVNMSEFYNSTLGLPYIDEHNRGVSLDQLNNCINKDLSWSTNKTPCVMGVDQGLDYLVVTVAQYNKDSTKKIVKHLEVIERNNPYYYKYNEPVSPYERLHEIMKEFNIGLAVIDGMPNYSEALHFAQEYPGKVFLANYVDSTGVKDTVVWNDKAKAKEGQRKAGPFLKFKYSCSINRFNAMSLALADWANGDVQIPHPDAITQMMRDERTNIIGPESPARRAFAHHASHIRVFTEQNEITGKGTWAWQAPNNDHFTHSWLYTMIALERFRRKTIMMFAND